MDRRKKRLGVIAGLLGSLLLGGCSSGEEIPALADSVKAERDVAAVLQGDLCQVTYYDMNAVPQVEEVLSEEAAVLKEWKAALGDTVKQGDVIAVLEYRAQTGSAAAETDAWQFEREAYRLQAEIEKAKLAYALEKNDGSKEAERNIRLQEIEVSLAELALAEAEALHTLESGGVVSEVSQTKEQEQPQEATFELKAPCDGVLVYRTFAVEGDLLPAFSTVAAVAGEEVVLKGAYLSESVLEGLDRIYTVLDGKETELTKLPYSASDYAEGSARFYIEGEQVAAGAAVTAYLISDSRENVTYIPVDALRADKEGYYVYVLPETGEKVKRNVEIGLITMSYVEIVAGVEKGERVLVTE